MSMWRKTLLYLGLVEEDELEDEMHAYEEPPRESSSTIRKISRDEGRGGGAAAPPAPRAEVARPGPHRRAEGLRRRQGDRRQAAGRRPRDHEPPGHRGGPVQAADCVCVRARLRA